MFNLPNQLIIVTNKVLTGPEGDITQFANSGGPLASLMARLWKSAVILGALALIIYFIWGAIEWLTSSGDSERIKGAHHKIIDAITGMAVLVASYAAIKFLSWVFGFDLLNIVWPTV